MRKKKVGKENGTNEEKETIREKLKEPVKNGQFEKGDRGEVRDIRNKIKEALEEMGEEKRDKKKMVG